MDYIDKEFKDLQRKHLYDKKITEEDEPITRLIRL